MQHWEQRNDTRAFLDARPVISALVLALLSCRQNLQSNQDLSISAIFYTRAPNTNPPAFLLPATFEWQLSSTVFLALQLGQKIIATVCSHPPFKGTMLSESVRVLSTRCGHARPCKNVKASKIPMQTSLEIESSELSFRILLLKNGTSEVFELSNALLDVFQCAMLLLLGRLSLRISRVPADAESADTTDIHQHM